MKIRQGFVSNSSSSSFVCVFPIRLLEIYRREYQMESKIIDVALLKPKVGEFGVIHDYTDRGGWTSYDEFETPELTDAESEKYEAEYNYSPSDVTWHFVDWLDTNYKDEIVKEDIEG